MINLKRCPFCGGKAELIQASSQYSSNPTTIKNGYKVGCRKCNIWTSEYQSKIYQDASGELHFDANGAIEAADVWDRRAEDE